MRPDSAPATEVETWWLVMRLVTWDSLTLQPNDAAARLFLFPIHVSTPGDGEGQPMGFLPVFRSPEDAEEWSENGKYTIHQVRRGT